MSQTNEMNTENTEASAQNQAQENEANQQQEVKETPPSDYVKEMLKEKTSLNTEEHAHSMRLLEQEIQRNMNIAKGRPEQVFIDLMSDKHVKVTTKVLVPVKEHPNVNFIGKLLGPKGNSLKRLQEETQTKIAIFGRGSVRDKAKEEELRNSQDPKYSHLCDDLHVQIHAYAPAEEAYARVAFALSEVRKFLTPDDMGPDQQFHDYPPFGVGPMRGPPRMGPRGRAPVPRMGAPPRNGVPMAGPRAPMGPGGPRRMAPQARPPVPAAKAKVMNILNRGNAMDDSYGNSTGYEEENYYDDQTDQSYNTGSFNNASEQGFYGYSGGNGNNAAPRGGGGAGSWRTGNQIANTRGGGGGGKAPAASNNRFANRPAPYSRPMN